MSGSDQGLAMWQVELDWEVAPQAEPVELAELRQLHATFSATADLVDTQISRRLSHDGRQGMVFQAAVAAVTTPGAAADLVLAAVEAATSAGGSTVSSGRPTGVRLNRFA